ncbi:MAG: hypothetical protein R3293_04230 [Candidatus Promineifilaceae bacterium]|nr:hypothetical protein [Candidatus Promineifilaceae bacterium]
MKKAMLVAHRVLLILINIGVLVQMFLAGLWHAGVTETPDAHVFTGLSLLLLSLLALIAAFLARLDRSSILLTGLLFLLILAMPILIEQRRSGLPIISAFHPVVAAFIGMTAGAAMRSHGAEEESPETGVESAPVTT